MKNLALIFCSIRPEQLKPSICDYRELEYYQTVQQLERIMPSNYDMVLVENTIDDPNEIKNPEIREYFSNIEIMQTFKPKRISSSLFYDKRIYDLKHF